MKPDKQPISDHSPESLETRLRALPPLSVPSDLEARLLAAIPVATISQAPQPMPRSTRRQVAWVAVPIALAAICVLIVLVRTDRVDEKMPGQVAVNVPNVPDVQNVQTDRTAKSLRITPRLESRRRLEESSRLNFAWPVDRQTPVMASMSIPRDLLE